MFIAVIACNRQLLQMFLANCDIISVNLNEERLAVKLVLDAACVARHQQRVSVTTYDGAGLRLRVDASCR